MGSKRYGNKALRAWWSIHVEAWRKSGLSRRKYCREHRLCEETFTRWLNVLGAEKLRADRELAREQKAKKRRPNLSTDKRNRAAQAFWAMHVEAQRWSGMTMRDYCDAHRISSHSMARWRDLIDAGETPSDWRSQLHPSARAPISTSANTGAKDERPNEHLTNGHAADSARVERFARRTFSDEEKRAMVLETEQPGATVSSVARRHDIVPSMLFRWRAQLGIAKEKPARIVDVSTTGKGGKNGSAAAVLYDLLMAPAGMTLVDLPDGRRVFAPAGADPDAVQRHVADWAPHHDDRSSSREGASGAGLHRHAQRS